MDGILVALFFPLDTGGELVTLRGKMHLILVEVMGILTIGGMLALWLHLVSIPDCFFVNINIVGEIFNENRFTAV